MAESEEFAKLTQASPEAWAKLMAVLAPISQPVATGRMNIVKSWGDINDTDNVWFTTYVSVSDTAAFLAAYNAWQVSPTGKSHPGQGHLFQMIAAGINPATHLFGIGYASMAEA